MSPSKRPQTPIRGRAADARLAARLEKGAIFFDITILRNLAVKISLQRAGPQATVICALQQPCSLGHAVVSVAALDTGLQ